MIILWISLEKGECLNENHSLGCLTYYIHRHWTSRFSLSFQLADLLSLFTQGSTGDSGSCECKLCFTSQYRLTKSFCLILFHHLLSFRYEFRTSLSGILDRRDYFQELYMLFLFSILLQCPLSTRVMNIGILISQQNLPYLM